MRNILLLIRNTLKITFRKKSNIFVYLLLPIAGVLLSVLIYNGIQNPNIRIGLVDKDGSFLSAESAEILKSLNGYIVSPIEEAEIKDQLLDRKLDAVIVIPEGFEEGIYTRRAEKISVITIKGQDTTAWIENYLNLHTRNLMDLSAASKGNRADFGRIYASYKENRLELSEIKLKDKQTGKLMTVTTMGFLIMFVMIGAGLTSQLILNEKRNRTYYRICSAPIKPKDYIAANSLTSLMIVSLQNIIILLVMKYVFGIETFVSGPAMFLIMTSFGIVAIGISLLITASSSSTYMASTFNTLVLTPTCMLGGCFWPVSLMPEFMRKISYFVPQRWALEAIQKLQAGGGFSDITINLVILFAFAAAMFLIAAYRFGRMESVQKFV